MPYIQVNPVIDNTMRGLCITPYPGHKNGCPNFGKKQGCPPQVPTFLEQFDINQPVFAVYNIFDMAGHMQRMKDKHHNWSDRQLRCCLYWQPGERKNWKWKQLNLLVKIQSIV